STLLLVLLVSVSSVLAEETRPNVLFIAVDDLRPQLGCYGEKNIHSPNIDKLANSGVMFEKAYCMVPTCGASRASMMSGIRPSRNRFISYTAVAADDAPGMTTMNTQFKQNGYYTVSLGKVFHNPADNAQGWSETPWRPKAESWYQRPENIKLHIENSKRPGKKRGPAWESADVADNAYADGMLAERAMADLQRLKEKDQPFFMAVGFLKPHLPFIAPQKYWELYDHDKIKIPSNYHPPRNAPKESIHSFGEMRSYAGIPAKGPVSDDTALNLIHGYYACVSYTDAQIGKLLRELDRLELTKDTIVVLWGDHGWNLGEHTLWCKHSCYETSMRIPLIIKAPKIEGGQTRSGVVESIDLYPTLCQLAGIPQPKNLQGDSLVGYLKDAKAPWKTAAIGRFKDGDTIRTADFRYTEYTDKKGKQTAQMIYKHDIDPGENNNVVKHRKIRTETLNKQLHEQMDRDVK
ncbi:MAG: sulfatase, partial [Pirellulales bacterium]